MIPVIDLFAGPGGLGEGFSSLKDADGNRVFKTLMSIEMDPQAHSTLRLRAFFREIALPDGKAPREYIRFMEDPSEENLEKLKTQYPEQWKNACEEAVCATLSIDDDSLIKLAKERLIQFGRIPGGPLVLIGGPPCQAYSLVGRARRTKNKEALENDVKQTLYKCYLAFIEALQPTVFVMENVKGMLSAKHAGEGIFDRINADMMDAGYTIHSLVTANPSKPKDYVVEAEKYGIPQARHRVILLGVKNEIEANPDVLSEKPPITFEEALVGIPALRSGFSERNENWRELDWAKYVNNAADRLLRTPEGETVAASLAKAKSAKAPILSKKTKTTNAQSIYNQWYRGRLGRNHILVNHESRCHLKEDLDRYLFCAAFAETFGKPAKLYDFPKYLLPAHKNIAGIEDGQEINFPDRFRVQLKNRCSSTITSHISKDGHYYIHPDPVQCRSLTVREAARLQTFPDDYLFMGAKTSQYQQVGNAVPPLLAQQISKVVAECFGIKALSYFDES